MVFPQDSVRQVTMPHQLDRTSVFLAQPFLGDIRSRVIMQSLVYTSDIFHHRQNRTDIMGNQDDSALFIDLFQEMDKKSLSIKERIKQEYYRVKELLDGKVPTRMELFTNMDDHIYEYCMKHSKENPFKRYMDFLYEIHELSDEELQVYNGIGKEFLQLIETTDMQKVYKMPILYGFYNDGNVRMAVTEDEVVESWKRYVEN